MLQEYEICSRSGELQICYILTIYLKGVIFFLYVSELYTLFLFMFSVLTPYYKEDVLYSEEELNKENEDGISILFYLQKIYPGTSVLDS